MGYKENLEKLKEFSEELVEKVENCDSSSFSLCQSRKGENNLRYEVEGKACYFHSNYDIAKESEKWFASLELEGTATEVLYVYGIGLGHAFPQLRRWLDEDIKRYVVFMEDNLAVLRRFLEDPIAYEILSNKQVLLSYIGGENGIEKELKVVCEFMVSLPYKIVALPHYQIVKGKEFDDVQLFLHHESVQINYLSVELMRYGGGYFRNFYENMLSLEKCGWAYSLFNSCSNIPAIICGAGPSLDKNFDTLKTLGDRAVLFAGGSAINALTARGLTPHLGGSVDPNPGQYRRMSAHSAYELPIFFKPRCNHRAFHTLHGPKLYVPGSSAYPMTSWFEEQLGIFGNPMREGFNVLHFLMELACFMGCNPIIFVGMDLAYTGNKLYADGVVNKREARDKDLTKQTSLNNNAFLREDIYGNPVYTLWKWVAEANFTSTYPKVYPYINFINCTEGGLGMEGIPNRPLKEVVEEECQSQYNIEGLIHTEIQEAAFQQFDKDKVLEVMQSISDSLEEAKEISKEIQDVFKRMKRAFQARLRAVVEQCTKEIEALKVKLEENKAHYYILYPLNSLRSLMLQRELDHIENDKKIESEMDRVFGMCDANIKELDSTIAAADVNLEKIEDALTNFEKIGGGSVEAYYCKKVEERVEK